MRFGFQPSAGGVKLGFQHAMPREFGPQRLQVMLSGVDRFGLDRQCDNISVSFLRNSVARS